VIDSHSKGKVSKEDFKTFIFQNEIFRRSSKDNGNGSRKNSHTGVPIPVVRTNRPSFSRPADFVDELSFSCPGKDVHNVDSLLEGNDDSKSAGEDGDGIRNRLNYEPVVLQDSFQNDVEVDATPFVDETASLLAQEDDIMPMENLE
jgi:hypothetical protein